MVKNVYGILTIKDAFVISVEKGNVEKDVVRHVCAFSLLSNESKLPIKVLLTGEMASLIWNCELRDLNTYNTAGTCNVDGLTVESNVTCLCTITGNIREIRDKEVVIENPDFIKFERSVTYEVFDDGDGKATDNKA